MNTDNISSLKLGNLNIEISNLYYIQKRKLTPYSHEHSFWEIHIALEGKISLNIEGKTYSVEKNQMLLIPKNVIHYTMENSNDFDEISWLFSMQCAQNSKNKYEYKFFSQLFDVSEPLIYKLNTHDRLILKNLINNLNRTDIYGVHKVNVMMTDLYLELARKIQKDFPDATNETATSSEQTNTRMKKVELFLSVHLSEQIKLKNLADYLFLSERQTLRFLQRHFNMSYTQLLTKYRMDRAKQLLKKGDLPLSSIAEKVGYSSYKGFLDCYKKYFRTIPSIK